MGLIRDVIGGLGQAVSETVQSTIWKEYFESGDMSNGILMKRGERILTENGKNRKVDNNLISSGSGIDVQEGQCMILVENGRIVEFCAEPGRYTYDSSSQPSLYAGQNKGLLALGKEILNQWSAGGQRFSTQRVYFINMGEIIGSPIKWGCGDIAFHHTQVYRATGSMLEMDMTLRANGTCTIQIVDPVKFYQAIGAQKAGTDGNAIVRVSDEGILTKLKAGIVDHINSAISTLGYERQIPYTAIKAKENLALIKEYLNGELSAEWAGSRGFGIADITMSAPIPTDENKQQLEQMQQSFNMSQNVNAMNYDIQKGYSEGARSMGEGFRAAGENGVFGQAAVAGGFIGGMGAFGMGNANMGNIQNQPLPNQMNPQPQPAQAVATAPANGWTCACGTTNTGKFCQGCGSAKPAPAGSWTCACGATNAGAFCPECGSKKPNNEGNQQQTDAQWTCSCGKTNNALTRFCPECGNKKPATKKYVCDKCGWTPPEGKTVRFCPECGDIFDDSDLVDA